MRPLTRPGRRARVEVRPAPYVELIYGMTRLLTLTTFPVIYVLSLGPAPRSSILRSLPALTQAVNALIWVGEKLGSLLGDDSHSNPPSMIYLLVANGMYPLASLLSF